MTYGCETWDLTKKVRRQINGANSIMLARITGKSFREEAGARTTSFDLVRSIRQRRMRWLGHILRGGEHRLIHQAVVEQANMANPGSLLMDAPPHTSLHELRLIAADRVNWRLLVMNII